MQNLNLLIMKRFYFLLLSLLVSSMIFANDGCFQPLDPGGNLINDPECNQPSEGWGNTSVISEQEGAYCGNSGYVENAWDGVYQKNTVAVLEANQVYRVRAMYNVSNSESANIAFGGFNFELRWYIDENFDTWQQLDFLAHALNDGEGFIYTPFGKIDNIEVYKTTDPIILPSKETIGFSMADSEFVKLLYVQSANLPDADEITVTYPSGISGPQSIFANPFTQGDYVDGNNYRIAKGEELEITYDGLTDVSGKIRLQSAGNPDVYVDVDVEVHKYSQELLNTYNAFNEEDILGNNYTLNEIEEDLVLPTSINGVTLTWQSSREDVIATDGTVILQDIPIVLELTVIFSREGDDSLEKTFSVRTMPSEPAPYEIAIWKFDADNISFENGSVVANSNQGDFTGEKTYTGVFKNEAQIRVIGDEDNRFNVLDLGEGKGYFDMGEEIGKEIYKLSDFSVGAYFYVDVDAANVNSNGNFLWTFSNAEDIVADPTGYIFGRPVSVKHEITKTDWSGAKAIEKGDYFQLYPFDQDPSKPKYQGVWHHILYVQYENTGTFYIDGELAVSGEVPLSPMDLIRPGRTGTPFNWLGRSCYSGDKYMQKTLVYDFRLMSIPLTESDITDLLDVTNTLQSLNLAYEQNPDVPDDVLSQAVEALDLGDLSDVVSDVVLPTYIDGFENVNVFWTSSDPFVISEEGAVNLPKLHDAQVTLTAHLIHNGRKVQKEFVANVPTDGTPFESTLVVHYDFSEVDGRIVTDIAEKNFKGTMMNDAKIATLEMEDGTPLDVLDLGNGTGYFDLGYEIGQIMYDADDYTISTYFYIDENYDGLDSYGNYLWTFSNSETTGTEYIVAILRDQRVELKGDAVETVGVRDEITDNYVPAEKGRWVHFAYVQNEFIGSVYIDGELKAEEFIMNLPAIILPTEGRIGTMYNWIGRSCYSGDAYLRQTMIYDFRMYTEAFYEEDFHGDKLDVPATLEMLNSATIPSGVRPVNSDNLDFPYRVYAVDGKIMIDKLLNKDHVSIYDMFGRKIEFANHMSLDTGIYMVRINDYPVVKIMVK